MKIKRLFAYALAIIMIVCSFYGQNSFAAGKEDSIDWETRSYTIILNGDKTINMINTGFNLIIKGKGTLTVKGNLTAANMKIEGEANVVVNNMVNITGYAKIDKNASLTINYYPKYLHGNSYAYVGRGVTDLYGTLNINSNYLTMDVANEFNSYGNLNIYTTGNLSAIQLYNNGQLNFYSGNVNINVPNGSGISQYNDNTKMVNIAGGNVNIYSKSETISAKNLNISGGTLVSQTSTGNNGPNILADQINISNGMKVSTPAEGIIKNVKGMMYKYGDNATTGFNYDCYAILNKNGQYPAPKKIIINKSGSESVAEQKPYTSEVQVPSDSLYKSTCFIEIGESKVLDIYDLTGHYSSITTIKGIRTSGESAVSYSYDPSKQEMTVKGVSDGYETIWVELEISNNGITKTVYNEFKFYVSLSYVFSNATTIFHNDKITIEAEDESAEFGGENLYYSLDGKTWAISNTLTRNQENDNGIIYVKRKNNIIEACHYDITEIEAANTVDNNIKLAPGEEYSLPKECVETEYEHKELKGDSVSIKDGVLKAEKTGSATYELWNKEYAGYDEAGNIVYKNTGYVYNITVADPSQKEDDTKKQDGTDGSDSTDSTDKSKDKNDTGKYSNEWVNGKWYNQDGTQTYEAVLQWKESASGWWVEDLKGWFPKSEWQKIDGKWYYFCADGYMDYSEYRDGCWLGADGAWDENYSAGHWMSNETGWWYEDAGWCPKSQWLWIDGSCYYFDSEGYMLTNQWIDGCWVGSDGAWVR